ncbi:MAG: hypothetical protein ACFFBD_15355 [Candidatus Hodarchaeota archaeon]
MKKAFLFLGLLILCFPLVNMMDDGNPVPASSRPPPNAHFFHLNYTQPAKQFSLSEFTPDQSFIGYYNVNISCWVKSDASYLCRNLWNASAEPFISPDGWAFTQSYSFSRPTAEDPDFMLSVELYIPSMNRTASYFSWIYMQIEDGGTTELPPGFSMPEHLTNYTAQIDFPTPPISQFSVTGTQPVPFLTIGAVLTAFYILINRKKKSRKGEI